MHDLQRIVETLTEEYLDRVESEGPVALDRICAAHPEHADALRRVVASLSDMGLVGDPAGGGVAGPGTPQPGAGGRLGDYQLLRRIGGGGMGEVFLAHQQSLDRQVALKLLRPGLADSATSRARFQREIAAISRLDHVGICPVFDAGEVDGVPYLAMQYVAGESLAAHIDRHRREADGSPVSTARGGEAIREALDLFEEVARALHVAHEKGLVHRDVKPGNIMITPAGKPVLLDFGLVFLVDDEAQLTVSGDRLGTVAYMAPEQVRGGAVDRRTDVYGVGAALYEALTLHTPHAAPTQAALYHAILHEPVARASRHNRSIPRDVEVVLETALDPDPNRRYPTALALAEDLRRARRHETVQARPLPVALRVRRWTQRNPVVSVAGVLLVVGLAVSLVLLARAEAFARTAAAVALADASRKEIENDQLLAVVLAARAQAIDGSPEILAALYRAYGEAREAQRFRYEDRVRCARFSPDGAAILTGTKAGAVELRWHDGSEARKFEDPDQSMHEMVNAVGFSPTGRHVVAASRDGFARVWAIDRPDRPVRRLQAGPLAAAKFLDEAHVVLAEGYGQDAAQEGEGRQVFVWNHRTGEREWQRDLTFDATGMAVSGDTVVVGCRNGSVHAFSLMDGVPRGRLSVGSAVLGVAFSGTGDLVLGRLDGWVELRSLDGRFEQKITQFDHPVHTLQMTSDGESLLVAGGGKAASLLNLRGNTRRTFRGHGGKLYSACLSPDGRQVLTASGDHTARIWDIDVAGAETCHGHMARITDVAWSRDDRVATASVDGTVRLLNRRTLESLSLPHATMVHSLAFGPDGQLATGDQLFSSTRTQQEVALVHLWNGVDKIWQCAFHGLSVIGRCRFASDGRLLATVRPDRCAIVVDGKQAAKFSWDRMTRGTIMSAVFEPGEQSVLFANSRAEVFRWDLQGADAVRIIHVDNPKAVLHGMDCSPIDGTIVTAHADGKARLWTPAGRPIGVLGRHEAALSCAVFSPKGRFLATAGADKIIRLWRVSGSGTLPELVADLEGHAANVTALAFSPEEDRLLSGSADRTSRVWITNPDELVTLAKSRSAGRELTPAEWAKYGSWLGYAQ